MFRIAVPPNHNSIGIELDRFLYLLFILFYYLFTPGKKIPGVKKLKEAKIKMGMWGRLRD